MWLGEHQAQVIEYQRAENAALLERSGKRRLQLTDGERRRLARLGKTLGRKALQQVATIATPDTILRWYLNAYSQRFVLSIKSECLDRIVPLGEAHLRRAIREYVAHYHSERNHQGLANVLLTGSPTPANTNASVLRRERLGGLLNYYHRNAA